MGEWPLISRLKFERAMSIAMTFAATQDGKKFVRMRCCFLDRGANIDAIS